MGSYGWTKVYEEQLSRDLWDSSDDEETSTPLSRSPKKEVNVENSKTKPKAGTLLARILRQQNLDISMRAFSDSSDEEEVAMPSRRLEPLAPRAVQTHPEGEPSLELSAIPSGEEEMEVSSDVLDQAGRLLDSPLKQNGGGVFPSKEGRSATAMATRTKGEIGKEVNTGKGMARTAAGRSKIPVVRTHRERVWEQSSSTATKDSEERVKLVLQKRLIADAEVSLKDALSSDKNAKQRSVEGPVSGILNTLNSFGSLESEDGNAVKVCQHYLKILEALHASVDEWTSYSRSIEEERRLALQKEKAVAEKGWTIAEQLADHLSDSRVTRDHWNVWRARKAAAVAQRQTAERRDASAQTIVFVMDTEADNVDEITCTSRLLSQREGPSDLCAKTDADRSKTAGFYVREQSDDTWKDKPNVEYDGAVSVLEEEEDVDTEIRPRGTVPRMLPDSEHGRAGSARAGWTTQDNEEAKNGLSGGLVKEKAEAMNEELSPQGSIGGVKKTCSKLDENTDATVTSHSEGYETPVPPCIKEDFWNGSEQQTVAFHQPAVVAEVSEIGKASIADETSREEYSSETVVLDEDTELEMRNEGPVRDTGEYDGAFLERQKRSENEWQKTRPIALTSLSEADRQYQKDLERFVELLPLRQAVARMRRRVRQRTDFREALVTLIARRHEANATAVLREWRRVVSVSHFSSGLFLLFLISSAKTFSKVKAKDEERRQNRPRKDRKELCRQFGVLLSSFVVVSTVVRLGQRRRSKKDVV